MFFHSNNLCTGAHGLRDTSDVYKEVWKTASFYHMIHTCGLGMSAYLFHGRKRSIVGSLFLAGIVLFSGSCYTVALMEERKPYGQLAPLGGFCLIFGWLAFGIL